ncbi:MAG: hypothetical protein WBD22_07435 [Pyrinomonadaceae bacterium]
MENDPNIKINKAGYSIIIFSGNSDPMHEADDNVDIQVNLSNGSYYSGTFFTLKNIQTIFEKNKRTGECASGLYFSCPDLVVVETLNAKIIERVIGLLVETGELDEVFERQSDST